MIWQHFWTFLWLRWRITVNQLTKGSVVNAVILIVAATFLGLLGLGLFAVLLLLGTFGLAGVSSRVLLYVWDGVVCFFAFAWVIGTLSELQRSETLALNKFLNLPVSLFGAFTINYLGSLASFSLIVFVPAMAGLSLGLTLARGPALLWLLPLLAAFVLMVSAVTYQFQGWLASLMVNKRRRQTIIVIVTMAFILLAQAPSLFHFFVPPPSTARQESRGKKDLEAETMIWWLNVALPIGWLPLGVKATLDHDAGTALATFAGMTLIGVASLRRSYRTTLRYYLGEFTSGRPAPPRPALSPAGTTAALPGTALLERNLPWIGQQPAAVALAGFRSLIRAPESKMLLLGAVISPVCLGFLFLKTAHTTPLALRPLLPFAGMMMLLLSSNQMLSNQFGFDRNGFRVFVLCGVPRRDILLGKNLALAPFVLGLAAVLAIVLQIVVPARLDHFLALPFQFVSMYLLACSMANGLSIFVPFNLPPGALRAAKPGITRILAHMAFTLVCFPLIQAVALAPLGIELLLQTLGLVENVPIFLVLTVVECAAIVRLYRLILNWEGQLLQQREQVILAVVSTKSE